MSEAPKRIAFVSTMATSSWGGSEALWSGAATCLASQGHRVTASVQGWPERPPQFATMLQRGVHVKERLFTRIRVRPQPVHSVLQPVLRNAARKAFASWLSRQHPDLVCISNGDIIDRLGLMNVCRCSRRPYVVIVQANAEQWWPDDRHARQLIEIYQEARRVFFVSQRNRSLLETQLGIGLSNAELVRNPFNVAWDASPPWPGDSEMVRFACVGRLEPESKGQDLLLHVLASDPWRSRPVTVSFFGRGDAEESLRRLAVRLGLGERVQFCGHVKQVESIWATHHALTLPSRYEGLPIAAVEAMLCGRPVIVTDVAGNCEIVRDGVTGFVAQAPTVRHLNEAMERAWTQREQWQRIGQAAAKAIRELVPQDPAGSFAQRLLQLARTESPS